MKSIKLFTILLSLALLSYGCGEKENEDTEKAEIEAFKNQLTNLSPWDWENYGEHAIYTFKTNGTVQIEWEIQDEGGFTGEYETSTSSFEMLSKNSFSIPDDGEDLIYTVISLVNKTMEVDVCLDNDCDEETFVSTK